MQARLNDKRRNHEVSLGYFAQKVQDKMLELSDAGDIWDVRRLSRELDLSYEYTRRTVRGETKPSKTVVQLLARHLQIPVDELMHAYNLDRIKEDYGTLPMEIAGKIPEMQPIEMVWEYLTDEHRAQLVALAQKWAEQDRLMR